MSFKRAQHSHWAPSHSRPFDFAFHAFFACCFVVASRNWGYLEGVQLLLQGCVQLRLEAGSCLQLPHLILHFVPAVQIDLQQ